jgi:hypothetical protein
MDPARATAVSGERRGARRAPETSISRRGSWPCPAPLTAGSPCTAEGAEKQTGMSPADLAEERADEQIIEDTQV